MKLLTSTTIAFVFITQFGCTKIDGLSKHVDPNIESAKAWLLSRKSSGNEKLSQINNSRRVKKLSENFEAIWKDALVHEDEDYTVIEIPTKFEKDIVVENGSTINQNGNKNGVVRLIVVKSKESGNTNGYFMVFKADNIVNPQDYKNLELNNYRIKKPNFNGTVTFFNLDWSFVNGWKFNDGLVSGEISDIKYFDQSNNDENEILSNVLPPGEGGGCSIITTTWYVRTCVYYQDGYVQCTNWEYMYSTSETVCTGTGGSGNVNITNEVGDNFVSTPEFEQFQYNYRARMSPAEIVIFDNMSLFNQNKYIQNAYLASKLARQLYPNSIDGGIGDAFRHALFHALNTRTIGYNLSKALGDAHEERAGNTEQDKIMDLINNQIGRDTYYWIIRNYSLPNGNWNGNADAMFLDYAKQRLVELANSGVLYVPHYPPEIVH